MSKLDEVLDKVRESDAYNQLKTRYDELDSQAKLYVNLGAVAACVLLVFGSVLYGIAKLNGMKSEINEREELIGYLQRSADSIKQLKLQASSQRGGDTSSPLPAFVESALERTGMDRSKVEIGTEHGGAEDKETKEMLVDVKLTHTNLRQLVRLLFTLTEQGAARNLNVKDLNVDTKNDPAGYIDADFTIANFKAK